MKLFDTTVILGGLYTVDCQAYGQTQQQASNNAINSLKSNYPNLELSVIKIEEVPNAGHD